MMVPSCASRAMARRCACSWSSASKLTRRRTVQRSGGCQLSARPVTVTITDDWVIFEVWHQGGRCALDLRGDTPELTCGISTVDVRKTLEETAALEETATLEGWAHTINVNLTGSSCVR